MTLPMSTTTITVKRPATEDPYETSTAASTVATNIRAHISSPSGRDRITGGDLAVIDAHLDCDPVDLENYDAVIDETTDIEYSVVWRQKRYGLGLDMVEAGLRVAQGASS